MRYRPFGSTGWQVSEISFGAWAIGASWGAVRDEDSMAALHRALDLGVNLFDTADVYGDGHSERLLARLRRERSEPFHVITKAGRRLSPHTAAGYTLANLRSFVERSLINLEAESLDLVQLHCPPTDVYYQPEVFDALDTLVREGLIQHYGVSVERVEEGLKALSYPGVRSVQIIFNMFRLRPAELFLPQALQHNVAVLARVPLASGLLTGKLKADTTFSGDDHRNFNRRGESFDVGETFSGVDYETALAAVDAIRALLPPGAPMAPFALRWILINPAISCAIPGAKTIAQVESNCSASELPALTGEQMQAIEAIYDRDIRALVHQRW